MSFRLPNPPSSRASIPELADYLEFQAWFNGLASAREAIAYLGRIGEIAESDGCEDEQDENEAIVDDVMGELGRRMDACGGGYPFSIGNVGTTLRRDEDSTERAHIYDYLLLGTRLNMSADRVHGDIDGAALLEELSAEVLRSYLGGSRAQGIVFGTAVSGGFEDKVTDLCKRANEGGRFRSVDPGRVWAVDDKLDVVVWLPFGDGRPGKMAVFAQCKTGTSWRDQVTQLQPREFMRKWMVDPFLVEPVRAFCVAEAVDWQRWSATVIDAGLLLDRCRLVELSAELGADLRGRIGEWVRNAKGTVQPWTIGG